MCGRFTLRTNGEKLERLFECEGFSQLKPRFNIAPMRPVAAVRASPQENGRQLAWLHWGFVPPWAKDRSLGSRMINARSETVATKAAFRHALRHGRCLIPVDGFYEWRREAEKGTKQPYYIHLTDDRPFAFAGLWTTWEGPDHSLLESCAILTTEPNEAVRPLHSRMPVILPEESHSVWLDAECTEADRLTALLKPFDAEPMDVYPVGTQVNRATYDEPDCIARMDLPEQGRMFQ
jgi:putative SOS response-associated peptidase YedK